MKNEKTKPTNGQLQRRIDRAVLHIDRTKDTKEVYFSDRGIRIVISDDVAIISRLSYTLMFNKIVPGGFSVNYNVLSSIVDAAQSYDCTAVDKDGNKYISFWKLYESVKQQDTIESKVYLYKLNSFIIWWSTQQSTMFLMNEEPRFAFMLNAVYVTNTIIGGVISKPYEKDMTNKELFEEISKGLEDFRAKDETEDYVVLKKETKEDIDNAIAAAMQEHENDEILRENAGK